MWLFLDNIFWIVSQTETQTPLLEAVVVATPRADTYSEQQANLASETSAIKSAFYDEWIPLNQIII